MPLYSTQATLALADGSHAAERDGATDAYIRTDDAGDAGTAPASGTSSSDAKTSAPNNAVSTPKVNSKADAGITAAGGTPKDGGTPKEDSKADTVIKGAETHDANNGGPKDASQPQHGKAPFVSVKRALPLSMPSLKQTNAKTNTNPAGIQKDSPLDDTQPTSSEQQALADLNTLSADALREKLKKFGLKTKEMSKGKMVKTMLNIETRLKAAAPKPHVVTQHSAAESESSELAPPVHQPPHESAGTVNAALAGSPLLAGVRDIHSAAILLRCARLSMLTFPVLVQ